MLFGWKLRSFPRFSLTSRREVFKVFSNLKTRSFQDCSAVFVVLQILKMYLGGINLKKIPFELQCERCFMCNFYDMKAMHYFMSNLRGFLRDLKPEYMQIFILYL